MRYTNLKHAVLVLAILSLALTTCTPRTYPTLIADSPTRLDDRPLCGLTLPEEDTPWHQVWRTDYTVGNVRDLLRDGDWLWVATPVNVVRLDLRTLDCTRFGLNSICRLLLDPDGQLWAAAGASLVRFDGQRWQAFPTKGTGSNVYNLAFDTAGNLWAEISLARGMGAFRYSGHEPPETGPWEGEKTLPPREYDCDQWFSRGGKFHSPEECRLLADWRERLASLAPPEGIAPWNENQPIAAETSDRLWMLAQYLPSAPRHYNALLNFDGRNWQVFPWPYGSAHLVADEARGGVWAGTGEGLIFSDGQSTQKYLLLPSDAVPVGPTVYDLVVDGSGRLWTSTDGGLLLYNETSDTWQPSEIGEWVFISADYQGGLWAASPYSGGDISRFDGNIWSHYPFPKDWPCFPVVDILADAGGGLWLSSPHCALRGFNGEVWDEYDSDSRGDLLARGLGGTVYAAGWGGAIKRYDGKTWETLLPADPSRRARVIDLAVGPEDEIWVAFDAPPNLIVYRDGNWENVLELVDETIAALLIGSQGDVWVGYSQGLLHYDGETWERIERETPFSAINALAEDQQGRIWVGGQNGLSVYDPRGE